MPLATPLAPFASPPATLASPPEIVISAIDAGLASGLVELTVLTIAVVLYGQRTVTLAQKGRPVPGWRIASFGFGLILTAGPLFTPLGRIAEELVLAHMVEHLVIGDIAPIFLVLGLTRAMLQPVLAIRFFKRLEVLAHPAVALPLWCLNLYVWHVPFLYEGASGPTGLHFLEHISFITFGCLMWMPVFGPLPMPTWFGPGWTITYTLLARFATAALGNALMWSGTVLYPAYAAGQASWGISPIADQSTAGAIMMVEGLFVTLPVLAWTFLRMAKQGTERQELLDLAYELGVPLSEERAQRAVAAGQGEALSQRLRHTAGERTASV
ncbi:MAG TPA: cytochrome c oxidase assembly protein [Solirubrobacterales bacterium]|nr:cytochrome c oxidase assembly protein [Solirubrobacterales bacterium]